MELYASHPGKETFFLKLKQKYAEYIINNTYTKPKNSSTVHFLSKTPVYEVSILTCINFLQYIIPENIAKS
jgi:hypothetical protein